jgi:hypothetical protein
MKRGLLIFALLVGAMLVLTSLHNTTAPAKAQSQAKHVEKPTPGIQIGSNGEYIVAGPPSITPQFINTILCNWHSPACGQGAALYDLGVKYGIDPAYALAFFMNESTFGTAGMARLTLGLGNERCIDDRPCINSQGGPCATGQSCYALFTSWRDGFEHWFLLIRNLYISQWQLTTVPQIIHRYAPSADNNDEQHYTYVVEHAVDLWRKGIVALQ